MLDSKGQWFISAGGQHSHTGAEVPNIIFSGQVPRSILRAHTAGLNDVDASGDDVHVRHNDMDVRNYDVDVSGADVGAKDNDVDVWGDGVNGWALLSLRMSGSSLTPSVNGKALGVYKDSAFTAGMAALGCGWHEAYFDRFSVA